MKILNLLKANQLINHYYHEIEKYPELIKPVFCYQDIIDHQQAGIMSSLLTLEEGAVVENDLSLLEHYYRLGVRMITLTWNHVNGIGYLTFLIFLVMKICLKSMITMV